MTDFICNTHLLLSPNIVLQKIKKKEREKVFKDSRRYFQRYYSRIFGSTHFVTR